MSHVELSIVIPAYNAAASLPRALDSLADERFLGRYEVLVVDDGSTDDTAEVCDNWCRLHPGIARCIRQSNGGVSSARNLGIAAANGDYIAFVDADDYAAPGYLGMAFDAKRGGEDYITFDYVREGSHSCIFSPIRLRVCGKRGQQDGAAPQRIRCRGLREDVCGPDGLLRCVRSRRG